MDFKALQAQLKAELEALNNKKAGGSKDEKNTYWFRPEEGLNTVRIVPVKGQELPFIKLLFHYVTGKTILSPRSWGGVDPIADFSDRLIREGGGKLSKDEFKAAKQFSPQLRTYVPIVVRGKEEEGIKFWAFGETTYKTILSIYTDEDFGNISDPEAGYDLKLIYTPKEKSDTNYAKTVVTARPKSSVLTENQEQLNKMLNEQPVLIELFKKWTPEELTTELSSYLSGVTKSGPQPTAQTTTPSAETPAVATAPATPTSVTADVEDEFAKIFNNG